MNRWTDYQYKRACAIGKNAFLAEYNREKNGNSQRGNGGGNPGSGKHRKRGGGFNTDRSSDSTKRHKEAFVSKEKYAKMKRKFDKKTKELNELRRSAREKGEMSDSDGSTSVA